MCQECGAPEETCQARFDECLVKEFTDTGYGRVHHLTVSTFMLQHSSRLTRAGWLYERDLLREFLLGDKSPEQVRKERQAMVDSGRRAFKITSRDGMPLIAGIAWSGTILDIRMCNAAEYRDDVVAWAAATQKDSELINLD